jgi:PHD/YefM family antitoxin component YafN of YafNO toxin-antitoxin module
MTDVIASAEARERLPKLIEELVAEPKETFEVGRQRRREVVLISASRYDEMVAREDAVRDLAWSLFALDRVENPTSEPVSWEEAQRRRRSL